MNLLEKAKTLPKLPGCYLMKNIDDEVIYVGKAKELNKRVISYFNQSVKTPKTEILVGHIKDFEFIITASELEALVLENNLIKKHSPKYNIRMRDDKSYPYIVIKRGEKFPRLEYKRRVKKEKGVEVFGPFATGSNISEILRIIIKSFRLRDCSDYEFKSRKRPCLLYQMNQCTAPCVEYVSADDYQKQIELATDVFGNKGERSLQFLEQKMLEHAENEEFEQAAIIRGNLSKLYEFINFSNQKNAELDNENDNVDVISFHVGEIEIDLAIYMVRNGILLGNKNFHFPLIDFEENVEDEILKFLLQYYSETFDSLPELLVIDLHDGRVSLLEKSLEMMDLPVKMHVKTSGRKFASLMQLVSKQARESQRIRIENKESVFVGLNRLKELLKLKERPRRLECYDIAIWQGKSPTASQIVYEEGKPNKKKYRYYHLQEREEGNNDFAMMKEVLSRRLKKKELPDVFIVDGGKGQVNVFIEVLKDFGLTVPVVGIAKAKAKGSSKTEERLIIPGRVNPFLLKKNISLFRLITSMRDEAHRFSRKLHHKAEKKRTFGSWLDVVEGIGPKRKKEILSRLDLPVSELKKLTAKELEEKLNVSASLALKIANSLQS